MRKMTIIVYRIKSPRRFFWVVSNFGYLHCSQVYHEAIRKVMACIANTSLKDHEKVAALSNARRFIIAWGMERGDTLGSVRFLTDDPFADFAKATNYPNPHIGRFWG